MKVTFIRPNMADLRSTDAMQPLVFAILAGLTPPDIKTVLYDERLEPILFEEETDLVVMTVETYTARRAYEIASFYRQHGVRVVMGGYHPTFLPQEALQYADAVVIGDAEGVWEQVLKDAGQGHLQKIYQSQTPLALNTINYDRSIFNDKKYVPINPVQYGRGCRFACDFCSIHAFYGSTLRQRPVHDVVREIQALDTKHIFLVDDNIFIDIPLAKELFQALIPLKIRWSCQVSVDVANNPEVLKLMEKSGCTVAIVGFESLDERNLLQMKKPWNTKHGRYAEAIKKFQEHGIMIYGTFVIGYDHDNKDAFDINVEFALRSNFYLANFNPLMPMPGTKVYDRLCSEKRLIYKRWWLDPQFYYGQAAFHPKGMTAEELTAGCFQARRTFNTYRSIVKRAWAPKTNCRDLNRLGIYLASNLISKREIVKKQGLLLGKDEILEPAQ